MAPWHCLTVPHGPQCLPPSHSPASDTPWDILESSVIMHKLLGRDKAFLCHQPRFKFCGWDGGDPGQNAVPWAPSPYLWIFHSHSHHECGRCINPKQPICCNFYLNEPRAQGGGGGLCRRKDSTALPPQRVCRGTTAESGFFQSHCRRQQEGKSRDPAWHLGVTGTLRKPQWGHAIWCLGGPGRACCGPGM